MRLLRREQSASSTDPETLLLLAGTNQILCRPRHGEPVLCLSHQYFLSSMMKDILHNGHPKSQVADKVAAAGRALR